MNPTYCTIAFKRIDDILACDQEITLGSFMRVGPGMLFRRICPIEACLSLWMGPEMEATADAHVNGQLALAELSGDIDDQTFVCYDCSEQRPNGDVAYEFSSGCRVCWGCHTYAELESGHNFMRYPRGYLTGEP